MTVWALGDLHLAFGAPAKSMDAFGEPWLSYADKIKARWHQSVQAEDLVLLPGDISWAMHPEEAKIDLEWIDGLPGTKVMVRGNHDYWWTSLKKIEILLPPSLHLIQNNAWVWKDFVIGGTRLWDCPAYQFDAYIRYVENPRAKKMSEGDQSPDTDKIFARELGRLEMSLKEMSKLPGRRIVMTHYPPIGADLGASPVSTLLERYHVSACVFGHLHNVMKDQLPFGESNGVRYVLASADYLNFTPIKIF